IEIQIITLILAVIAVVLGVIILSKVNKLTTMLRTPIVKKLSPDMNLKPSSRHAVSAQELASRGERNHKENRNNHSGQARIANKENNRTERSNTAARNGNDRRDRRHNNRNDRTPRPETTPVQENSSALSSAEQASPVQNQPKPQVQQPETRRPLTPRIQAEVPVAPVVSAPIAAPVAAETAVNDFDPSKVRYGRRNVVKKLPELADED